MDTVKTIAVALATALVAVLGFGATQGNNLGGVPGVNIIPSSQTPYSGVIHATSTPTNSTLTSAAMDDENVIDMTLTQGSGTLTLPASSSIPGIPSPGDTRTIWIRHATGTVGVNLTIAANTGVTLKNGASSTVMLIGDTDADNTMRIDFVRKADSDINAYLYKYQD